MQCCPDLPGPTLHKKITCVMLAQSPKTFLHMKIIYNFVWIYLGQHFTRKLPMQCWPRANRLFFQEINLQNVLLTMLGQHCIEIFSGQCCPNSLHNKIICSMLAQTCFCRKTSCNFKCMFKKQTKRNIYMRNKKNKKKE